LFASFKTLYPSITLSVEALCAMFYEQWLVHMTLDPSVAPLLDALDTAHIPFGIITNGTVHQNLKIDRLGLRSRTGCLFISEVFGCSKPEAAIFHAAAAALNVPCEHILFVGDNPVADVCGAHAVSMTTAWLHRGTDWPAELTAIQPDYVLGAPGEIARILHLAQSNRV
jgi:putative hydrolase of the HAD superfamily